MAQTSNYRAPALEKGLDILELIVREVEPLSLASVSERLGRSKSEIFRMMLTLEARGYISRTDEGDRFQITDSLFMLGLERPPTRNLLEVSLPQMHRVANAAWQSCHLVVASGNDIVVIARVDSPSDLGYGARIGHKRPISQSASGSVLFAFQPEVTQQRWLQNLRKVRSFDEADFIARAAVVKSQGYARVKSVRMRSVIDISVPLLRNGRATATMVVPYVEQVPVRMSVEKVAEILLQSARTVSKALSSVPVSAVPLKPARKASSSRKKRR